MENFKIVDNFFIIYFANPKNIRSFANALVLKSYITSTN